MAKDNKQPATRLGATAKSTTSQALQASIA